LWHTLCVEVRVRLLFCAVLVFATRLLQAEPGASADCELPLQFREGLLWMEVSVPQSKEPLHFLVDSGASASVVNLSTARRLGLKLGPKVTVTAVATTLTGHWPVKLSAQASGLELPDEYLALDLSKLSGACSRPVDGLIGADFFRGRIVEIDYAAQKLRVLSETPDAKGTNAVPLEARPCGFRVAVNVNGGRSQWVRVDTGCATAFQWVTSKERADRCTSKLAVGLAELSIPQTMVGLRIGNHHLDTVPTGLHRKAIFPGESGLLGNGLLAQFGVVIIDAKSGRLFLGRTLAP
jgi:predicted aspartyl protease